MNKYYIHVDETSQCYDTSIYEVEAESPKEAYELWIEGEGEFVDSYSHDYGDTLDSELNHIETEDGTDVTNEALESNEEL